MAGSKSKRVFKTQITDLKTFNQAVVMELKPLWRSTFSELQTLAREAAKDWKIKKPLMGVTYEYAGSRYVVEVTEKSFDLLLELAGNGFGTTVMLLDGDQAYFAKSTIPDS